MEKDKTNYNLNSMGLLVTDHVSAMLAYWDKNQICQFANSAFEDWFGRSRIDMIGQTTMKELLGPFYETYQPFVLGALDGNVQTYEREIPTPTGEIRYALVNFFPDIKQGHVQGFFAHVADITQVKLLEMKLIRSNESIIKQNKQQLNFANMVSHNLNSYANNLKLILGVFINSDSEIEKNQMLNYLEGISKGFSLTVSNLNDIVEAQNLSAIKQERINLYAYIQQSILILEIQFKLSHVVLENKVSPELYLMVNPAYFESILLNLLTNAIKYKHPDRDPVIEISAFVTEKELVLEIKDNGIGIDLEKHEQDLFGMYNTFNGNPDATGIGLYITKYQIEALGGSISVKSEVNIGSVFSVHFKLEI